MGTNARCQKPKCLDKPKNYTAIRKKTGGNFGLEGKLRIEASTAERYSLIALTIVTTLLLMLIARNGASHFISGSGNTSTKALVIAKNCLSGLFNKSDRREWYAPSPGRLLGAI